jgi:hypothetical protein
VQFCNKPFKNPSYAEWNLEMSQKVLEWRAQALEATETVPEWFDFSMLYNTFMLHRPCLPNPEPDLHSVTICFEATERIVDEYWASTRSGFLKFPWHALHNCFEAGVVLLYNINHYPEVFTLGGKISLPTALNVLDRISIIFGILSKQWPSVWQCREFFDTAKSESSNGLFGGPAHRQRNEPQSSLNILEDIVLHRPGDKMYVKSLMMVPEERAGEDGTAAQNSWRDLSTISSSELDATTFFDFAEFEMGFSDLDWAYITSSELITTDSAAENLLSQELPETVSDTCSQTPQPLDIKVLDKSPKDILTDSELEYLGLALARLPSCTNCRKRRKRCDRLLPSCLQCEKSGQECKFYDSVLLQDTPRPYVFALKKRFDSLRTCLEQRHIPIAPLSSPQEWEEHLKHDDIAAQSLGVEIHDGHSGMDVTCSIDELHFGGTSVFARLAAVASKANLRSTQAPGVLDQEIPDLLSSMPLGPSSIDPWQFSTALPSRAVAENIAHQYYHSFELVYPILGLQDIDDAINCLYCNTTADETTKSEAFVTVHLILAIMTRQLSRKETGLTKWSKTLFERALREYKDKGLKFGYPSPRELRLYLLICWYLYLDPGAGNIWRFVGQCSLSAMDLKRNLNSTGGGSWEEWVLFITLFRMER